MTTPRRPSPNPILAALERWLTGLLFALLLSAFIVLLAPGIPGLAWVVRLIEVNGVDAAMSIGMDLEGLLPTMTAAPPDKYVFVDLDLQSCLAAKGGDLCRSRTPATSTNMLSMLATILRSGAKPRLIILDGILWDEDENPRRAVALRDAAEALRASSIRVLAVAPFRPTQDSRDGAVYGAFEWRYVPAGLRDLIAFAPAYVLPDTDGLIRRYPAYAGAQGERFATLAFLAAHCEAAPKACDTRYHAASHASDAPGNRMLYTLPPLAIDDGRTHAGSYRHLKASTLLGGNLQEPLSDAVVIISTSEISGLDRHATPVGQMTGAELTLNAVRSFRNGWQLTEATPGTRLSEEWTIAFLASLPFLAFWYAFFAVSGRIESPVVRGLAFPLAVAGFGAAVFAAMLVSLLVVFSGLDSVRKGYLVGFFTPLFALSLEGFAEGARFIFAGLEHLVGRFLNAADNLIVALRAWATTVFK